MNSTKVSSVMKSGHLQAGHCFTAPVLAKAKATVVHFPLVFSPLSLRNTFQKVDLVGCFPIPAFLTATLYMSPQHHSSLLAVPSGCNGGAGMAKGSRMRRKSSTIQRVVSKGK